MIRPSRLVLGSAAALAIFGGLASTSASCATLPIGPAPADASFALPEAALPRDAAKDTRPEAEAASADVWQEAGPIPVPGEWLPIPGFPASCGARVAKDPRVSVSRLPWQPCASGRVGCEYFLADWGKPDERRFDAAPIEPVFEDANGIHVSYKRHFGRKFGESQAWQPVVQLLHGEGEATWYTAELCPVQVHGARHGIALTALQIDRPNTPEEVVRQFLGWSSWASPSQTEVVETALTPRLNISQSVARGPDFLTLESTNWGGPIIGTAFRFASRDFARATPTNNLEALKPLPVGDGYVSIVTGDPATLAFMPIEGGYRTVVRPAAGYGVNRIALDRANSDALVWTEAVPGSVDGWRMWTSPYATTEAGAAKRPVAVVPGGFRVVANAGVVAIVVNRGTARIVRLSDGMGWDIPVEPGLEFYYPLWVNDDSAWFVLSVPQPPFVGLSSSGAVRVKRAGLGAPTVPNGL